MEEALNETSSPALPTTSRQAEAPLGPSSGLRVPGWGDGWGSRARRT